MYPITKGGDLPPPQRKGGNTPKYPWPQLEVGDSFTVEYEDRPSHTPDQISNTLASSASSWSRRNRDGRWKFTTRQTRKGVRVWRTE